ncbi:resolvase [Paenibacillus sp. FSL H8-0283]|uniref:DUF7674 family protein n=1 Tax=Paenibacillus sp. FSL H8-0283 TaxID=2921383 RepID=UPI0032550CEE
MNTRTLAKTSVKNCVKEQNQIQKFSDLRHRNSKTVYTEEWGFMIKKSEEFLKMMLNFFPSTSTDYKKSIENHGMVLETVIIEGIFMPEIIKLLSENRNNKLLESIFDYFEEVSNCKDDYLIDSIFSVTVLEILGNDEKILRAAQEYMGPKTMQLQLEADRGLGRIR